VLMLASLLPCRGHLSQGRALMAPYLPRNGMSGSPYSEGGAL
jgi:26S proteasome regulatory subunit N2